MYSKTLVQRYFYFYVSTRP